MKKVQTAIKILQWAIENKTSLNEAQRHFKVNKGYVRDARAQHKAKDSAEVKQFLELYDKFNSKTPDDGLLPKDTVVRKNSVSFSNGVLDARGNVHVKELEVLLKEAKVDTKLWRVDRHVLNKWDVTNKFGNTFQNWQIKAWLSPIVEAQQVIDYEKTFIDLLAKHKPVKYPKIKYPKLEENLLEVNIFDLHLGKLCWSEEVNNNYDTKIAIQRFHYALGNLIHRAKGYGFEKILFPVGNDFFHSDTHTNTTTAGTPVDVDVRWQKTFNTGVKLLVEGIDYMKQFAPVHVMVIPGNHDFTKSFFLGVALAAWYRNDESVTVDNSANPRKYYEYGNVLLGLTHGDKEKIEALRSLMAYEAKEAWGRTTYKEFHLGHQHRKLVNSHVVKSNLTQEELGITIRQMSSLSGTDAWHHHHGFLGPTRAAEAFVWSKEGGLLGQINSNIKLHDDK